MVEGASVLGTAEGIEFQISAPLFGCNKARPEPEPPKMAEKDGL